MSVCVFIVRLHIPYEAIVFKWVSDPSLFFLSFIPSHVVAYVYGYGDAFPPSDLIQTTSYLFRWVSFSSLYGFWWVCIVSSANLAVWGTLYIYVWWGVSLVSACDFYALQGQKEGVVKTTFLCLSLKFQIILSIHRSFWSQCFKNKQIGKYIRVCRVAQEV